MSGTFVLSLDLEMAWGSWSTGKFDPSVFAAEPEVARRLDRIAVERRLPFTWAVVGAIVGFDTSTLRDLPEDAPITEILTEPPALADAVPTVGMVRGDLAAWVSPGLIPELAASAAGHEIASHTFFHSLPTSSAAMADDLERLRRAVPGLEPTTLVFPRDRVDAAVVRDSPIACYRGLVERPWFQDRGRPHGVGKVLHLMEQGLGSPAPLASVRCGDPVIITSSALLTLRHGIRRLLPARQLRHRLHRSVEGAIKAGGIFHLWTHPWNLAIPGSDAFDLLAETLEHVAERRDRGDLEVLTRGEASRRAGPQR